MGNNRQLAKNSIYNISSFAINLCISFFFTPYLIRVVGKDAYSFFPLVNNLIGYSSIITTAVGGMAGRFVTMKIYQKDIEGAAYYYNSVLVANWILSIAFTILSCIVVVFLDDLITIPAELDTEVKILFAFACGTFIVGLMTNLLGLGCFVKNRLDASSLRSVITKLFRVGMILLCFSIFNPSIIYMSSSAFAAAILLAVYNIRLKSVFLPEIPIQPKRYFNKQYLREMMASSVWSSINQLGMILVTQLDLLITNIFIGVAATGDYSIAKTVPALIISFIGTLCGVFVPSFNILYAKGQRSELIHEIKKSMKMMGFFSSIPIGFLLVYGKRFFDLWVPGQDSDTIFLLSCLSLIPLVFNGTVNPLFHIYAVVNKVKNPSLVFMAFGLFQTCLVFLLLYTTSLGLWSIPIASLVASLIKLFTYTPMYAAYCLHLPLLTFHKPMLKTASSCIVTILLGLACIYVIPSDTWVTFITSATFVCVSSLITLFYLYLDKSEKEYLLLQIRKRIKK